MKTSSALGFILSAELNGMIKDMYELLRRTLTGEIEIELRSLPVFNRALQRDRVEHLQARSARLVRQLERGQPQLPRRAEGQAVRLAGDRALGREAARIGLVKALQDAGNRIPAVLVVVEDAPVAQPATRISTREKAA